MAHRKNILLGSFLVIMTIATVSYLLPLYMNLAVFIIITLVHVLRKQFGLVKVFSSIGGILVDLWTWLVIGIVGTLALVFAAKAQLDPKIIKISYYLVYLLNISFVVLGFFIYRKVVSTKGKYFFLVNLLSIPLATFFLFFWLYIFCNLNN